MFIEGATSAQTKWKAPVSLSDEVYSMKVIVSDAIESVSMSTLITIGKSVTSSISGFVYFSGCTLPISGATVAVSDKSATTDSDGYFLFDGIPVGETILVANIIDSIRVQVVMPDYNCVEAKMGQYSKYTILCISL
jgi:hypothetical protein